ATAGDAIAVAQAVLRRHRDPETAGHLGMSVDIATSPNFAEIDRKALGVDPGLQLAATYVREVEASIARVWENVFDWEHLPALHAEYFCDVRLLEEHARGWRVAVTRQPGGPGRHRTPCRARAGALPSAHYRGRRRRHRDLDPTGYPR